MLLSALFRLLSKFNDLLVLDSLLCKIFLLGSIAHRVGNGLAAVWAGVLKQVNRARALWASRMLVVAFAATGAIGAGESHDAPPK